MAPRQPLECYYCLEEAHSAMRCNNLMGYSEKIIVLKHEGTYLFPNFQIVPTEGPISANKLVRHFFKEQEEFTKKVIEKLHPPPKKQETTVIDDHQDRNAAAIDQIEEWEDWRPPQISPANKNIQINFGLRKTQQRASRLEAQIQAQKEHKNETQKCVKKKIPGSSH
ncbi:hypothetical protein O181_007403 [Austropuccinia psidii MF-1]|uniref:Uncharacterized protein n=1 Tax=Austropuccinia psidii MF-1 TaxID=1389203 RepID=A0A9Q3BM43_9BASI|nr:hypothetical protein [Austropuccinia psidii MF-1]